MIKAPKPILEIDSDDTSNINQDIESLAQKYLGPIDAMRSISRPVFGLTHVRKDTQEYFKGLTTDPVRPLESRIHTFYRMIGFPVAGPGGKFYNPGFIPNTDSKNRLNVDSEYNSSSLIIANQKREIEIDDLKGIFRRKDLSSAVFALLLKFVRKFQVLDEELGPFDDDVQKFEIKERKQFAQDFFKREDALNESDALNVFLNTSIGNYSGFKHSLRPFLVDPAMENTVMPIANRIAVPFLKDKTELKVEKDTALMRPGLELIIRERLRDSANDNIAFLEAAQKISSNDITPSKFNDDPTFTTFNNILLTVEATLGASKIDNGIISDLKKLTDRQISSITELVRTLKVLAKILVKSIGEVSAAQRELNWIPLCNEGGPEMGSVGASLYKLNKKHKTELDKRIAGLQLKKLSLQYQVTSTEDLGIFASPFTINVTDENIEKVNEELAVATQKRDLLAKNAFESLRDIELISGEISGLGLIDVISIYIALWSMGEKALISLLDDSTFQRMKDNFPELLKGAAASRSETGDKLGISDALEEFETKLIHVLSFVDKEIQRLIENPKEGLIRTV